MQKIKAKIISYDGRYLKIKPSAVISEELLRLNSNTVELSLDDGRTISEKQRKKIFAIIRDISLWQGDDPEVLRIYLTWDFCNINGFDLFSLSTVDMTTAREFINYLIEFCFYHRVPTKQSLYDNTDDIQTYLYLCLKYRRCAICNMFADVHHTDVVGMGRNRNKIIHLGLRVVALCRGHHNQAHMQGKSFFIDNHIYGIQLTKELCEKLNLKAGDEID